LLPLARASACTRVQGSCRQHRRWDQRGFHPGASESGRGPGAKTKRACVGLTARGRFHMLLVDGHVKGLKLQQRHGCVTEGGGDAQETSTGSPAANLEAFERECEVAMTSQVCCMGGQGQGQSEWSASDGDSMATGRDAESGCRHEPPVPKA
jgi:prepilin-type processing-associated H-X9-DG protein